MEHKHRLAGAASLRFLALAAALVACAVASGASAQSWGLDPGGLIRIPTLEELTMPPAPRASVTVPSGSSVSPLAPFLGDPTLRKGDIVATRDGLMQFNGRESYEHSPSDFAPVREAGPKGRRKPLPQIQPLPQARTEP